MSIDQAAAERKLKMWMDAEDAAASGKSYTIDGLTLSRQDLASIRASIQYWSSYLDSLQGHQRLFKRIRTPGMGEGERL